MCGRATLLTYDELADVVRSVEQGRPMRLACPSPAGRLQARPGAEVNAVLPAGDALHIAPLIWGFASERTRGLVFNTRIESALGGSRMWDGAIREGRCILPVASFFEPHATETDTNPRTGRPVKRQYEFASEDGAALLLAAVQREGRLSVVTTEPNAHVAPIHPRMPLVLRFREVRTWLSGDWQALVDRSGLPLHVAPELPSPAPDSQLALF